MASAATLELASKLRRLKRSAERTMARALFALQGKHRRSILSDDQVRQFNREGYLLVSELIPDETCAQAEVAMWRCMGASRDSRESWTRLGPRPRVLRDPRLSACYTDEYLGVAAQLAGDDVASFLKPRTAYTVNVLPEMGEWQWGLPHVDHANKAARHRTFPRAFRVATMVYLNDVETHGGGTAVWPGSHRRMQALARSNRRKYRYMWALNLDVHTLELNPPVELTPRRGDILLYHYLCVHAGTTNLSQRPRLALRTVW